MEHIRVEIERRGLSRFEVSNLCEHDLDDMSWAGDSLHFDIMRNQIGDKTKASATLAVYAPCGTPVSKGYVVHDLSKGESTVSQLATHPALQSLGLGTMLIEAIENRILSMGVTKSVLGVETVNPRARRLYEKLGYNYFKTDVDSWEAADANGRIYVYKTDVDWLVKNIRMTLVGPNRTHR